MPEQVKSPSRDEKFEINSGSTGITESDGQGALWADIWAFQIPLNQKIIIKPTSIFACNLVGDDAAAMPNNTQVRVLRRDVSAEDQKTILPACPYKQLQEFRDRNLFMRFLNLGEDVILGEGEWVVVQVNGADATGTGDTDASASYFKLICNRRRKPLG